MANFIVYSMCSPRPRAAEGVYAYPGEDFVVCPWVCVRPVVQFLVDPSQEGNGGIMETVGEGLWFGGLNMIVTFFLRGQHCVHLFLSLLLHITTSFAFLKKNTKSTRISPTHLCPPSRTVHCASAPPYHPHCRALVHSAVQVADSS